MGKKKISKPKVTDADNRTVCQSKELQDKNDEKGIIIDPTPSSENACDHVKPVQKRKLKFKVPGRKKNKSCVPSEIKYIDSEEEIELHRSLTKELLQFAQEISDDEFCVMKNEIEKHQHPNYRNMDAFFMLRITTPRLPW